MIDGYIKHKSNNNKIMFFQVWIGKYFKQYKNTRKYFCIILTQVLKQLELTNYYRIIFD